MPTLLEQIVTRSPDPAKLREQLTWDFRPNNLSYLMEMYDSGTKHIVEQFSAELLEKVRNATPTELALVMERNGIVANLLEQDKSIPEETIRRVLEMKMPLLRKLGSPTTLAKEYESRADVWRNDIRFIAVAARHRFQVPDDMKVRAITSKAVSTVPNSWQTSSTLNAAIDHVLAHPSEETVTLPYILKNAPPVEPNGVPVKYQDGLYVKILDMTDAKNLSTMGSLPSAIISSAKPDDVYAVLERKISSLDKVADIPFTLSGISQLIANSVSPYCPLDQKNADMLTKSFLSQARRASKPGSIHIQDFGHILSQVSDEVLDEAVKDCHTATLSDSYKVVAKRRGQIFRKLLAEDNSPGDVKRFINSNLSPGDDPVLPPDIIAGAVKRGVLSALLNVGYKVPTDVVHSAIESFLSRDKLGSFDVLELKELLGGKQGEEKIADAIVRARNLGTANSAAPGAPIFSAASYALDYAMSRQENERKASSLSGILSPKERSAMSTFDLGPTIDTALKFLDASELSSNLYSVLSKYKRKDGTFPALDADVIERLKPLLPSSVTEAVRMHGGSYRAEELSPAAKKQVLDAAVHISNDWASDEDDDIREPARAVIRSLFNNFPGRLGIDDGHVEAMKEQILSKHGRSVESLVGELPRNYLDSIAATGDIKRLESLGPNKIRKLSPQYLIEYLRQKPGSGAKLWEELPPEYARKVYEETKADPQAFGGMINDIDARLLLYRQADLPDEELKAIAERAAPPHPLSPEWDLYHERNESSVIDFVNDELASRNLDHKATLGDPYAEDDEYNDDEDVAEGHTASVDADFKLRMKEWGLSPEAAKVGARFDTTKWRKLRDMIASASPKRMLHDKEVQKILPGDWKRFKDNKGMISADTIQAHIDATPVRTYNVNHRFWMGEGFDQPARHTEDGEPDWDGYLSLQRHNDERQKVTRVCASNEMVQQMREQGVWHSYKKLSQNLGTGIHPNTKGLTLGWVRWTGTPKHGIFIDEIQSDMHELLNTSTDYDVPEEHAKKLRGILYGNKEPTAATGEVFFQWLRDQGHVGTKIAIHGLDSKARISLSDYPRKPAPVHHRDTYEVAPKKTWGMESTKYNKENMPTQSNPHFQDKRQIWQDTLNKYEQGLEMTEEEMDLVKAILGL